MEKIKLNNILCSVNFLVMCSVVKSTSLCYVPWQCFILFTVYCTQLATIPSSKLLVTESLHGSNSHSSKAKNADTICTYLYMLKFHKNFSCHWHTLYLIRLRLPLGLFAENFTWSGGSTSPLILSSFGSSDSKSPSSSISPLSARYEINYKWSEKRSQ